MVQSSNKKLGEDTNTFRQVAILRVLIVCLVVAAIIFSVYILISWNEQKEDGADAVVNDTSMSALQTITTGGNVRSQVIDYAAEKTREDIEQERAVIFGLLVSELVNGYKNNVASEPVVLDSDVCKFTRELTKNVPVLLKPKVIVDYIYENVEYDWGNIILDTTGKPKIKSTSTVQQTFETKKATCGEEANLFMYMARCVSAEAYFIYGGAHAWNILIDRTSSVKIKYDEIDTRQHCYGCLVRKPIAGLCSSEFCTDLNRVLVKLQEVNIIRQTLGDSKK